jgi:hypothetical protein
MNGKIIKEEKYRHLFVNQYCPNKEKAKKNSIQ